jgi:hypothetical protein
MMARVRRRSADPAASTRPRVAAANRTAKVSSRRKAGRISLVDHFLPCLVTFGSGGVAAAQGKADRHPDDVLDATMNTAVYSSLERCAAHLPALPWAGCSDCTCPPLVIVVGLTVSMLGGCNG